MKYYLYSCIYRCSYRASYWVWGCLCLLLLCVWSRKYERARRKWPLVLVSERSDANIHSDGFSHRRSVTVLLILFFYTTISNGIMIQVSVIFHFVEIRNKKDVCSCDILCYQETIKYPLRLRWSSSSCCFGTSSQMFSLLSPDRCCRFWLWVAHKLVIINIHRRRIGAMAKKCFGRIMIKYKVDIFYSSLDGQWLNKTVTFTSQAEVAQIRYIWPTCDTDQIFLAQYEQTKLYLFHIKFVVKTKRSSLSKKIWIEF